MATVLGLGLGEFDSYQFTIEDVNQHYLGFQKFPKMR